MRIIYWRKNCILQLCAVEISSDRATSTTRDSVRDSVTPQATESSSIDRLIIDYLCRRVSIVFCGGLSATPPRNYRQKHSKIVHPELFRVWIVQNYFKQAVGGRPPRYAPPRPATEARSGSLEPGWPSRARSPMQPAGRTRRPPTGCTRQTSDVRQTDVRRQQHHRLMPPGRGITNVCVITQACFKSQFFKHVRW